MTTSALDLSQHALQRRFARNLSFFQNNLPGLYTQLLPPPTTYNLLFGAQGFNIVQIHDGALFFPYEGGKHQMVEISRQWAQNILQNPKWQLKSSGVELGALDLDNLPLTKRACDQLLALGNPSTPLSLGKNFYPPSALFGLAGGLFLALLLEEGAFFHALYIYEEHIDLLRVSCFFVDYAKLFKATPPKACVIFLKRMPDTLLQSLFHAKRITHSFLHLEFKPYESQDSTLAQQRFNAHKKSALRGWGSFEDEMLGLSNTLANLQKSPLVLNPHTCKPFSVPICVVGNGPSLDGLLDFIQTNQDRMIIFSCGTALKPLKARGIAIDFQIEIERIDYLAEVLQQAPLDQTPLIYANMCNPKAVRLAQESYLFMRGGSASGYLWGDLALEYSAPFVGNAGVSLACLFSKTLILCGLDCGYIEGQAKHAQGSFYGVECAHIPSDALEVRPNFEQSARVFADGLFILSKNQMGALFKKRAPLVYNLSRGAYIEHTQPMRSSALKLPPCAKAKALKRLKRVFQPAPEIPLPMRFNTLLTPLKEALNTPINTKRELYALIDRLHALSMHLSAQHPLEGILLEGTLSHCCMYMLSSALSLPQAQIAKFYTRAKEIILETLERMGAQVGEQA
ncbi:6-hydroxymethylpterin diphosphokinase MptE-like protein [Helicobacter labacensis]|uniref:6-hydroxymethylpterin diphosphokinase MptE-like protein n=1 Tax=Helicobacter labacensis TaxID=2316079 RepID=UPI000EB00779|nr:6-hydroxymethylpterin diphosphokinase MptE-like protein [Helicobacter labacensis]